MGKGGIYRGVGMAARFTAFISYSHADEKFARRLHRKLELYHLPKHIGDAGMAGQNGQLGKFFRDRDDLPATGDLSRTVREALAVSDALIVICSPSAKASRWVTREIELFRSLYPSRPVLPVLFSGTPETAFPEPLFEGREPLAADFQPAGDGKRLGLLKLVSGLSGVPLDMLVQRDSQRRVKRLSFMTTGAMTGFLVMSALTITAYNSRNEARMQRIETQDMMEFMLTDLSEKIEGSVGELKVLNEVNSRLLQKFQEKGNPDQFDPVERMFYAMVLSADGKNLGDRKLDNQARERFKQAGAITLALITEFPDNPRFLYAHARIENRTGSFFLNGGQYKTAQAYLERAGNYLDRIPPAKRPDDWVRSASFIHGNLCSMHQKIQPSGQNPSLENCREAVRHSQTLHGQDPDNPYRVYDLNFHELFLARAYDIEAQLWAKRGQLEKSRNFYEKARSVRQVYLDRIDALVQKHPDDPLFSSQKMEIYRDFGKLFRDRGLEEKAMEYFNIARKIGKDLIGVDPENQEWRAIFDDIVDLIKEGNLRPTTSSSK